MIARMCSFSTAVLAALLLTPAANSTPQSVEPTGLAPNPVCLRGLLPQDPLCGGPGQPIPPPTLPPPPDPVTPPSPEPPPDPPPSDPPPPLDPPPSDPSPPSDPPQPSDPPPPPSSPPSEAPVYDPAYAEGSSEEIETFLYETCSGYCPLATTGSQTPSASTTGCSNAGVIHKKMGTTGQALYRTTHMIEWCYSGGSITRFRGRIVRGEILLPSWAHLVYPWEWELKVDQRPNPDRFNASSYVQFHFWMCGVFRGIGPICNHDYPWSEIRMSAYGTAVCFLHTGKVRNCDAKGGA